jgi:hypothetical protein
VGTEWGQRSTIIGRGRDRVCPPILETAAHLSRRNRRSKKAKLGTVPPVQAKHSRSEFLGSPHESAPIDFPTSRLEHYCAVILDVLQV